MQIVNENTANLALVVPQLSIKLKKESSFPSGGNFIPCCYSTHWSKDTDSLGLSFADGPLKA